MYISKAYIRNYKSFLDCDNEINFNSRKTVIIGKNNSGKSNLISAIDLLLGNKDPRYIQTTDNDYNDVSKPLIIELHLLAIDESEIYHISLPKKHQNIFYSKYKKEPSSASIIIRFRDCLVEEEKPESKFTISVAGLTVHQKIREIRAGISRLIIVPPYRSAKDDLKASNWTIYGNLMKSILENSEGYDNLRTQLNSINSLITKSLEVEKTKVLERSRIITFIDDLKFQLTKENNPSELLRNLEILVKEGDKYFYIQDTGTGTQSAVIISILELALTHKSTQSQIFIVEEPELYLHPQGIRYLGVLFNEFLRGGLTQLITTTHSQTLLSTYNPKEIIRLDKSKGYTEIHNLPKDYDDADNNIFRALKSGNSELFFADKVVLVEGETEFIILPDISRKYNFNGIGNAYLLRHNISIINVNGKENISNYIKLLDGFSISWCAIVDLDFLDMEKTYFKLMKNLSIPSSKNKEELILKFKEKGIYILPQGEIEDLIPISDLSKMASNSETEISKILKKYNRTSDAFEKEIFKKSKPECALDILEYYNLKDKTPFESLIRFIYQVTN